MWVVLFLPQVPRISGKTKRLYASLKAGYYTEGQITDRLVARLTGGGQVVPSMLFNVFDDVARDSFTGLKEYWEQFLKAGAREVHLAGSGPALFTIMKDKAQAEKIYRHLQGQGLESYLVETISG
jgi:4-diphosphocytidyl-2-C-methyl-D-erythritol kinase